MEWRDVFVWAKRPVGTLTVLAVALASWFLGGAVAQEGPFGASVAAWIQAIGSVGAIAGAAWIAGGQSREARAREERDRLADAEAARQAQQTKTLVCSRLVSVFRVKVQALFERLCEHADAGEAPRVGLMVGRGFEVAFKNLAAFPMSELTNDRAVMAFARAIEDGDDVLVLLSELRANEERADDGGLELFAERRWVLQEFVDQFAVLDDALRNLAEPGWRQQVTSAEAQQTS